MIRAGLTCQIISWVAMMSCGYWMIGRPSHEKLYEYCFSIDATAKSCAAPASVSSRPLASTRSFTSCSNVFMFQGDVVEAVVRKRPDLGQVVGVHDEHIGTRLERA